MSPGALPRTSRKFNIKLFTHSFKGALIRLEMRKRKTIRIEQVLVSNSSLVSGLSETSGVKSSLVEVPQESQTT